MMRTISQQPPGDEFTSLTLCLEDMSIQGHEKHPKRKNDISHAKPPCMITLHQLLGVRSPGHRVPALSILQEGEFRMGMGLILHRAGRGCSSLQPAQALLPL